MYPRMMRNIDKLMNLLGFIQITFYQKYSLEKLMKHTYWAIKM